ncbi:MAG: prolyl oligopeptidase family serine peptidase [Bacteroidales bacterium]|nr:prolyl oligopeptidase family serine peptidase [Bacteroidales bacterium]
MKSFLLLLMVILPLAVFSQKKPLCHADYDGWKSLSSASVSDDGNWIRYEINPQEGDGYLYIYDVKNPTLDSAARGFDASFSANAGFIAYSIKPAFAETRQAKVDKKKKDNMPGNSLGIKVLATGTSMVVERVKSFKVAEDGGVWMVYLLEKPVAKEKDNEKGENEGEESPAAGNRKSGRSRPDEDKGESEDNEGTELIIFNPIDSVKHSFSDVVEYTIAKNGSSIGFVQVTTDSTKINHYKVNIFDTGNESSTEIFKGDGDLKKLIADDKGIKYSFIYTSDTSKVKVYDLYLASGDNAIMIVNEETKGMIDKWSVSENGTITFSDSGSLLFFGTAEKPVKEPEDTLLDEEKYHLDIWSWHDPLLQPQQKVKLKSDRRATFRAVYHIEDGRMVQLADREMPSVRILMKGDGDFAVGSSNLKYRKLISWESNRYSDYYSVDVKTGKRSLVLEAAPSAVNFSPSGKQIVYWCIETKSWLSRPAAGGDPVDLTKDLDVAFHNELHDSPSEPSPYSRMLNWIDGEKYVLIDDRYDIWKIDVSCKEKPVNLTNGFGRVNNIRFRYQSLEGSSGGGRGFSGGSSSDKLYVGKKEMIHITAFNYHTKESGLFSVRINKPADPDKIVMNNFSYRSFIKAKDDNRIIFQKGNYVNYPELYVSDMRLNNQIKISVTNPQQCECNWGTNELVKWRSFDGKMLQGILYKPEDFDPSKRYPMIVYFYERSSDGLHRYMAPAPSASTINRTYAVSNGYLIFVPDIPYIEGYPGQSAYNAVVSGTYAMLGQFDFIDFDRLGLDGQSWGGYQIAYLITKTDLFACAFSGAPVSNMTSAYGGIRWGSGMSRMFQYEKTQSRIGGTLWEKPIHYIENSPIFFVPKINTPVLIMHNDSDGAVPWYQGIEFFVALRRLEKPAWLLSYNDEDHNLRKRPNKKDLSVRKMQFFDHYLKGVAPPYWMEKGISQLEKGKTDGYDLMK